MFKGLFWLVGGDIFELGGGIVAVVVLLDVEVQELELVVECYEAGLRLFGWEDIILVAFESDIGGHHISNVGEYLFGTVMEA